jgi:hypothetical protein
MFYEKNPIGLSKHARMRLVYPYHRESHSSDQLFSIHVPVAIVLLLLSYTMSKCVNHSPVHDIAVRRVFGAIITQSIK